MIQLLFVIIAALGLLAALGTVLARNLVHAALFLVAFFFVVACQFVLLEAEFLAAMQVLVYIGAVAVLMMFGIMLTRNVQGDETTGGSLLGKLVAGVIGLGVLGVLVVGIGDDVGLPVHPGSAGRPAWTAQRARPPALPLDSPNPSPDPRAAAINNMAKGVGDELMTRFAVPFEVAGLLLTAALVGAIALAMGEGADDSPRAGVLQKLRRTVGGNGHAPAAPHPADAATPANPSGAPR